MPAPRRLSIVPLTSEDAPIAANYVAELLNYIYEDVPAARDGYLSWHRAEDLERRIGSEDWLQLVAKRGDRVVGIALSSLDAGIGTLLWLYVSPVERARGVGSDLVEETCRILMERGCHKADVLTRSTFPHLRRFYGGLGFTLSGEFHRYRYGIDTLYFMRDLDEVERPRVANILF
ncbi:MAG: GNAT family N-acetyltransferase [Deltaproteobacteria bacterium]|nr:GNAT family N-acetyltransferase [Deltaproteobacteria bacterium]